MIDRIDRQDSNIEELGKCLSGLCVIQDLKVRTYWEKETAFCVIIEFFNIQIFDFLYA